VTSGNASDGIGKVGGTAMPPVGVRAPFLFGTPARLGKARR
jgi:hypothetical protein